MQDKRIEQRVRAAYCARACAAGVACGAQIFAVGTGLLLPLALILPLALTYGEIFPSTLLLEDVACRLSGHAQAFTRSDLERKLGQ